MPETSGNNNQLKPLQNKVAGLPEHNLRFKLHNELHAGGYELLTAPLQVSHIALFSKRNILDQELQLIAQLCERYSVEPPQTNADHFAATLGSFRMKWERHSEYSSYTFFVYGAYHPPGRPDAAVAQDPHVLLQAAGHR